MSVWKATPRKLPAGVDWNFTAIAPVQAEPAVVPQLFALDISAASNTLRCSYAGSGISQAGIIASMMQIEGNVKKRKIDAVISSSMNSAQWNSGTKITRPSIPRNAKNEHRAGVQHAQQAINASQATHYAPFSDTPTHSLCHSHGRLRHCIRKKARTSKTVRQERRETGKKIERTRSQIKDNGAKVRNQLADLDRLQADIKVSNAEISRLNGSIDSLRRAAGVLTDSVAANTRRVEQLQASYASSLRTIRSQRQIASSTAYLFSSRTFTEARKRMRYLKELNEWQKEKANELLEASRLLEIQKEKLDSTRTRLSAVLASLRNHKSQLHAMQSDANTLVVKLKRQGSSSKRTRTTAGKSQATRTGSSTA